jgi:hypothetical protein
MVRIEVGHRSGIGPLISLLTGCDTTRQHRAGFKNGSGRAPVEFPAALLGGG